MGRGFIKLGLSLGAVLMSEVFCLMPVRAQLPHVRTSTMINNENAGLGLRELIDFLESKGLRVGGFRTTLPRLIVHEEGEEAAGVFLTDVDDGLTVTSHRTPYNGVTIVRNDSKTHLILRKAVIHDLIERHFADVDNHHSPIAVVVRGLLRASIFYSKCSQLREVEEEPLVNALAEHIAMRVNLSDLFLAGRTVEARQAQANLTALVSEALAENVGWEQCYADLGHLLVSVDFDTMPNGTPIPEGLTITDQYLAKGVIFDLADTLAPPDALKIDDASFEIGRFFRGMSLSNVVTNHGFSPGPSSSLGCESNLKVTFIHPLTELPMPVSSVSLRWFAGLGNPASAARSVRLIGRDIYGRVIAKDEFKVKESFFAPASFSLRVFKNKKAIVSVETQGVTQGGICTAFDNLAFWPPVQ